MLKQVTDQLGRTLEYNFPPKSIVSLVPSQTEFLFDMGLEKELKGITRFCIHPKEIFESKVKIGGTKNFQLDKIRALKPDIIFANKEENYQEGIEELSKEFPIWVSDIKNTTDALEMMEMIGSICDRENEANVIIQDIRNNFSSMSIPPNRKRVVYLIWNNPMMTINQNTFIDHIIQEFGFENVFSNHKNRYPEIKALEIQKEKPDMIFLSSEPFPFKEKHLKELETLFPNSEIKLVDGEMFSWYGSRMKMMPNYLKTI